MLEKSLKKMLFDAHFHYFDCINSNCFDPMDNWNGCTCAHSVQEWEVQKKFTGIKAYGLHPQSAVFFSDEDIENNMIFLNKLCSEKKVHGIGETGFDLFTQEYKDCSLKQQKMFEMQLETALKYNLPVIIHCRKANNKLFEYSSYLRKLPAVLFHSFMGTPIEAKSLISRGINGFFSFGKQLFNNNKNVIACFKELPLEKLLLETDGPYQFLKGETKTYISEIEKIYLNAKTLRPENSEEEFYKQIEINFNNCFSL